VLRARQSKPPIDSSVSLQRRARMALLNQGMNDSATVTHPTNRVSEALEEDRPVLSPQHKYVLTAPDTGQLSQ
jgi:hypothetical protein